MTILWSYFSTLKPLKSKNNNNNNNNKNKQANQQKTVRTIELQRKRKTGNLSSS